MTNLPADSHNILKRWKNYFSQLLNVHGINNVRQIEIHTAEPLAPEPSPFEDETAIQNMKCTNCHVPIKFWQN